MHQTCEILASTPAQYIDYHVGEDTRISPIGPIKTDIFEKLNISNTFFPDALSNKNTLSTESFINMLCRLKYIFSTPSNYKMLNEDT